MILRLYENNSDNIVVDKTITQIGNDINGTLRENCSIIDPVITIENLDSQYLDNVNYAYIPSFGRYYYVNNVILKGKLFEFHMHVDVLMSYKAGIRNNNAIIARQQYKYNLYLRDGAFKVEAGPIIQIKQFSNGFTDFNFIFSVAG